MEHGPEGGISPVNRRVQRAGPIIEFRCDVGKRGCLLTTQLRTKHVVAYRRAMEPNRLDFDRSLEELTGLVVGDPKDAPTPIVEWIRRSWKKPLSSLTDEEIGRLIVHQYGLPFVLDLVWPKLRRDPHFDGGYYPGDVLSNLVRWEKENWQERPEYEAELQDLYERAMQRPIEERDGFLDSLNLPIDGREAN